MGCLRMDIPQQVSRLIYWAYEFVNLWFVCFSGFVFYFNKTFAFKDCLNAEKWVDGIVEYIF